MRLFALTLPLLLAGCGQNASTGGTGNLTSAFEQGFRTSYRTKFVESCTASATQAAARAGNTGGGIDFPAVCGCAADRLLATKSVSELMGNVPEAEQMAVMQACVQSGGEAPPSPAATPTAMPTPARAGGLRGLHDS